MAAAERGALMFSLERDLLHGINVFAQHWCAQAAEAATTNDTTFGETQHMAAGKAAVEHFAELLRGDDSMSYLLRIHGWGVFWGSEHDFGELDLGEEDAQWAIERICGSKISVDKIMDLLRKTKSSAPEVSDFPADWAARAYRGEKEVFGVAFADVVLLVAAGLRKGWSDACTDFDVECTSGVEEFIAPLLENNPLPSPELRVLGACDPSVLGVLRTKPKLKIDDAAAVDDDQKTSLSYLAAKEAGAAFLLMKAFDLLSASEGRILYLKLLGGVYAGLLGMQPQGGPAAALLDAHGIGVDQHAELAKLAGGINVCSAYSSKSDKSKAACNVAAIALADGTGTSGLDGALVMVLLVHGGTGEGAVLCSTHALISSGKLQIGKFVAALNVIVKVDFADAADVAAPAAVAPDPAAEVVDLVEEHTLESVLKGANLMFTSNVTGT
jgi:hypothetical protein